MVPPGELNPLLQFFRLALLPIKLRRVIKETNLYGIFSYILLRYFVSHHILL